MEPAPTLVARCRAALASPWFWGTLLAVGLLARLRQYLGQPSFWYDEAYLLVNIYHCSYDELIGPLRAQVIIPPFFLWLLRAVYDLLGGGELAMRLPALVSGVAALLLIVPLARRVVGSPACWWVAALCAVSHHALTHSYEVRPYMTDFLLAVALLLAAVTVLRAECGGARGAKVGLLLAAALVPWLSFASAFVLAGISLTLLVAALAGRRDLWRPWLALNAVLLVSACLLWYVSARHLYYPGLHEHWGQRFPDLSAPPAALRWLGGAFLEIGHYGSTGLGVPLLTLASVGLVSLARRAPSLALLLVAPVLAGVAAACLRKYPFGDRLLFYTVPGLWLLAVEGVLALGRAFGGRLAWAAPLVALALVAPGLARTCKHAVVVAPRAEFREAFAYLRQHRGDDDTTWVTWPEVYEVYHPDDRPWFGCYSSAAEVVESARGKRLWVVAPHEAFFRESFAELAGRLAAEGRSAALRHRVRNLEVLVYDPPARSAARE